MAMKIFIVTAILLLAQNSLWGQKLRSINLSKSFTSSKLFAVNRILDTASQNGQQFIHVEESKGEGIIWLPVKNFKKGVIEIEMRGKDVLQKSFIGLAFHGLNDRTYDAVYCRPFNFLTKDSVRRIHAIQYIAHPVFTWKKLREEQNAIFEKEIINPPDPNGWFTMRVVIDNVYVKAFINDKEIPSLTVKKLNNRMRGKIGIFVGDGSGGDFKTVKVLQL